MYVQCTVQYRVTHPKIHNLIQKAYIVNLDNSTEFGGSRLNAPRRNPHLPEAFRERIKPRRRFGRVKWGPDVPIEAPKPPRRSASKRFVGIKWVPTGPFRNVNVQ